MYTKTLLLASAPPAKIAAAKYARGGVARGIDSLAKHT